MRVDDFSVIGFCYKPLQIGLNFYTKLCFYAGVKP